MTGTPAFHNAIGGVYALDGSVQVLAAKEGDVVASAHAFGDGRAVYLNGFTYTPENARLLYRAILWAARREALAEIYLPDQVCCECAYFPKSGTLVVINNGTETVQTRIQTPAGERVLTLEGQGIAVEQC